MKQNTAILLVGCWLVVAVLIIGCWLGMIVNVPTITGICGTSIEERTTKVRSYRGKNVLGRDGMSKLRNARQNEKDMFWSSYNNAVAMIHLGRAGEAIPILEEFEQQKSGDDFKVASYLGTAYELVGDIDEAIVWIKKSTERSSDSSTYAWKCVHLKVLEAKLQLAKDPEWLETNTVLGFDFGRDRIPTEPKSRLVDETGKPLSLDRMASAIEWELYRRLSLVAPPDPIVADLLFDLANLIALSDSLEHAIPVYEFAQEYGVRDSALLRRRVTHMQSLVSANPWSGKPYPPPMFPPSAIALITVSLDALIVVAVIVIMIRRRARD